MSLSGSDSSLTVMERTPIVNQADRKMRSAQERLFQLMTMDKGYSSFNCVAVPGAAIRF
jgi:hypothetical protein